MSIIVDTSVWSLALRRNSPNVAVVAPLQRLIADGRVMMLGAIRQEILSGIRNPEQFERLQRDLRAFPDLELATTDYELAADFFNRCRRQGVQGSNTDFLICAAAHQRDFEIFTTDRDFQTFQIELPIKLFGVSA